MLENSITSVPLCQFQNKFGTVPVAYRKSGPVPNSFLAAEQDGALIEKQSGHGTGHKTGQSGGEKGPESHLGQLFQTGRRQSSYASDKDG
jgi:hypothetical protein